MGKVKVVFSFRTTMEYDGHNVEVGQSFKARSDSSYSERESLLKRCEALSAGFYWMCYYGWMEVDSIRIEPITSVRLREKISSVITYGIAENRVDALAVQVITE